MDISKLNTKQFSILFDRIIKKINDDPIENFVKAVGFIDLQPTPAQEVILKIVFQKELDSVEKKKVQVEAKTQSGDFTLIDIYLTEVEIYEYLTEQKYDPNVINNVKINKIDLICGRRSGKTLLSAIISLYCAISNNWKPFLKKTPFATVLIMSHSREFSDEVLEVIKSLVDNSPILSKLINKNAKQTSSTLNLITPWISDDTIEYSRVQIKVGAASSRTTRGVAACAVLLDEIAFYNLDENMKETDAKIMKAVRPALKQFGKFGMLLKLSSPAIKQGVLYNEYKMHRDGVLPESYAVFKAPTWVMNNIIPKEEFIEEWRLDPDGFDTEYRSNFVDSLSNFILPEFADMAVVSNVRFLPPDESNDVRYFAAIDAAYKSDAFTFTIVGIKNGRLKQYVSKGWKGSKKSPVSSFEVAEYIRNVTKQYKLDHVAADQFAFQPLREIFDKYGITLEEYTFTPSFKKKIYFNLKKLVHSQQIDLLDVETQTKEIKELVVEQSSTGTIRIGHPQGGSDDYSDSLAVASYLATENIGTDHFTFNAADNIKAHGVKTDLTGRAFGAPSPDMLAASGHLSPVVIDNSHEFMIDPNTGKLKRISDDDEDEAGPQFSF